MSLPGPLVAIVGPTASGKSDLAELVAERLASPVISVDAMQVYRGMDIGTAKVPVTERRVPLLMVDVANVGEDYSVKLFQRDARACVDELLGRNKTPVLCGGTGLYLNAIVSDMRFPEGEKGDDVRSRLERLAEERGGAWLYEQLRERDPESAALIHPNNVRRVIRALEMYERGRSYAEHHAGLTELAPLYDVRIWGLEVERAELYRRIEVRVDRMFEQGLVDEVRLLVERGLASSKTASQAIGYKEVLEALEGNTTMDEAREQVKVRTRRYAKRQLSWFRNDGRVCWIDATDPDVACERIVSDLGRPEGKEDER